MSRRAPAGADRPAERAPPGLAGAARPSTCDAGRLRRAAQPGDDGVGHRRPRRRAGAYFDLAALGAVVVKSLSAEPWPGNPAPRVHETAGGHAQQRRPPGPGRGGAGSTTTCPRSLATGARVVASIWGRTVDDYAAGRRRCWPAPAEVVAVEVNVSAAPTSRTGAGMFAHSARGHRRGRWPPPAALRPAPLGQAQPQRRRPRRRSPAPPSRPAPRP